MDNTLKEKIQADVITAMKAKETFRLSTLRLLSAAIKQREIDGQIKLDHAGIIQVIEKMIKQRQDSFEQFTAGNRPELAAKEQQEIDILAAYLPERLSDQALDEAISRAMTETQASSTKDMGKLMAFLKTELQGRADMGIVSNKVKERLK